jgi:hypothetical protein
VIQFENKSVIILGKLKRAIFFDKILKEIKDYKITTIFNTESIQEEK